MKKGLFGVQMGALRQKAAEYGVYETVKTCADIGYRCIEVSGIPMTPQNVAGLKRAGDEFGVRIAACTACLEPTFHGTSEESLSTDFDKIVADLKMLDCDILRIGMLPMACMGSVEKTLEFAKKADLMAERLKEYGIDLYYHNHHVEFVKYEGRYLLDIIRDATRYLGFELDIHWIHRGGENPVEFIRKYAGRIRLLHLKDYRIAPFKMPEGSFDTRAFSQAFSDLVESAEIGEGSLPVRACIEAGLDGGSEYFLIEQDDSGGRDPFESLRISRDHLAAMGYGDWFAPLPA